MVRQLHMEMDDEVFENTHPGCIWGVFHALNYNYWQKNVKKMLPYSSTKHNRTKFSKGTTRSRSRSRLIAYDSDEVESLLDVEISRIPVKTNTKKTSSTNKRSFKTRIKSLISEDPPKKGNDKRRGSGSPTQQKFQRTYSIHHLECNDYVPRRNTQSDSGVKQLKNLGYNESFNGSCKGHISEKYETEEETSVDVMEIYGVNKDMFAKVLRYTDGGIAKSFCNLETRKARLNLMRSGSYPSPKLSQVRNMNPIKLDHKQNEGWCHSKVDKLFADMKPQVVAGTTKYSRRTLSLNESSLEKYAQLLPKSSCVDRKFSSSKSLRLTNECSFKRVRSLSLIGSSGGFQYESFCDRNKHVENDSCLYKDVKRYDSNEIMEDMSNLVESVSEDDTTEVSKICKEMEEQIVMLKDSEKEEEINFTEDPDNKLQRSSSFSMVESNLEGDFECENNFIDKEASAEEFYDIGEENELNKRSYDDFDYVSDILDRSCFNGNNLLAPWYLLDQPLNPSVFYEVEACWPHEDVCPKDEFCCHHQLLFDLINELLVQIYDASFTYYPSALSSNCHVPPMPAKFNVLNEVWSKVSKIMSSKMELNQTVDSIVAHDMWSDDDRWMNLQLESECVALELEDMFFDEILEEIIC